MKLSKKMFCSMILVISMILLFFSANNQKTSNYPYHIAETKKFKDGLTDSAIMEFYQEDIEELKKISDIPIEIHYCDVDLNDDGVDEKIVTIRSAYHSGSHGDYFGILGKIEDSYEGLFSCTVPLWNASDNVFVGKVYILESMSDGYHDIEIIADGADTVLRYEEGKYQLATEE